jgi:hypothetical protein
VKLDHLPNFIQTLDVFVIPLRFFTIFLGPSTAGLANFSRISVPPLVGRFSIETFVGFVDAT